MADADPTFDRNETLEIERPSDDGLDTAPPRRKLGKLALMISVPLLVVIGGGLYWLSMQGKVSTDNAYVKQDMVSVSAEVGGRIVEVDVKENQQVKAGDLLFRVDPTPYQIAISQADAAIASAQASQTALAHDSALSGADAAAARNNIAFAQSNFDRQAALWKRGFTTKADYDAAQHALNAAQDQLRLAEADSAQARAKLATGSAVPGVFPAIAAAQAQRASAVLNLQRTEVRAPLSGQVSQTDRLEPGQQIISGLPVVTIVGDHSSYVEANFKETDLADMRVGQPAVLTFDAYPGVKLKGHVASIGAGTGSSFSVLPAQNATGNWVKVTQRVPVRIAIDQTSSRQLIDGLSTNVTVYTDGRKH